MLGLTRRLPGCFKDRRNPAFTEHAVQTSVMQRVAGIALGHKALNDHDDLVMAVLANKLAASRSDCAPLAGKSTLNRLELSKAEPTRYNKIAADSGVCREVLMAWCEANRVDYVFGLARNARLAAEISAEMTAARTAAEKTGNAARRFREFRWSTLDSGSRARRVIGKAEWAQGEANPR